MKLLRALNREFTGNTLFSGIRELFSKETFTVHFSLIGNTEAMMTGMIFFQLLCSVVIIAFILVAFQPMDTINQWIQPTNAAGKLQYIFT